MKLKEELNKNNKLKIDLDNYIKEIKKLKIDLDNYIKENKKLKDDLLKANKIISNFGNNNTNNIEILNLKNQLLQKDNEIKDLKIKLLQNNNDKNKFDMIVYFKSMDEVINKEPIRCSSNDTFAEIEEKLYKKHNDFRNTNNHHICNGRNILRFKTLNENKIKDEDVVLITKLE